MTDSMESYSAVECAACGRSLNQHAPDTMYDEATGEFYDEACYQEREVEPGQCFVCHKETDVDGSSRCDTCNERNEDR